MWNEDASQGKLSKAAATMGLLSKELQIPLKYRAM